MSRVSGTAAAAASAVSVRRRKGTASELVPAAVMGGRKGHRKDRNLACRKALS